MNDNILEYGFEYQYKVIASLLTDITFLGRIVDILNPEYFERQSSEWIVDTIIKYHQSYRKCPTLDVFKVEIQSITDDTTKSLVKDELKQVWKNISSTDLEFIKQSFLEFCTNQKMKSAILQSADLVKTGQYDRIKVLVDNALKAGSDNNVGHIYKDDIDMRLSQDARLPISTGWDPVDSLMDGGLAGGELGVLIAPPGVGKTWALTKLGLAGIKNAKTVVHYTLELAPGYTARRYDSCLLNIPFQKVPEYEIEIKKKVANLSGNLYVKDYPTKGASCNTFRTHLDKMLSLGHVVDMLVVDYGDLVKPIVRQTGDSYEDLGNVFMELRGLAGEYNIPIWTATQSGRDSVTMDIIQGDQVSDSFKKIMIADFIMSLSRKENDMLSNTGRWFVIKNRFGPDKLTLPSEINYNKGILNIYDKTTPIGSSIEKKSLNGDALIQENLKKKYKDLG